MFFNRARRLTLDGVFGDPSYAAPATYHQSTWGTQFS
jgi:hypothetical protein